MTLARLYVEGALMLLTLRGRHNGKDTHSLEASSKSGIWMAPPANSESPRPWSLCLANVNFQF